MNFSHCISTPIGFLEINGTDEAITAIEFKEQFFPSSKKLPAIAKTAAMELNAYFEGTQRTFSFPVQQEGTAFQQVVWKELLNIPYGRTSTYLTIAKASGDKNRIRAIGNANGKNKLAIVIPCHRVIGASGKLVGYAGGLWRKQWLLEHELKFAQGVQTLF